MRIVKSCGAGKLQSAERRQGISFLNQPLKKLEETDDTENYLETFERVATQHHWPEEMWPAQLAGLLTGRAQEPMSI